MYVCKNNICDKEFQFKNNLTLSIRSVQNQFKSWRTNRPQTKLTDQFDELFERIFDTVMKIRRKMHNKCVAVVRVLRTIRRYWIANINIRTAEVSIISLQQSARSFFSSLSLLFLGSCRCCFFACLLLYFFIPKSAKWFDGSYAELNCVVLNVDTNKSNVQFNVNRIRFLTLSSLFFLIRFNSSAPVVTVPPNEAIELRFVGTMKLLWQMYVTKPHQIL